MVPAILIYEDSFFLGGGGETEDSEERESKKVREFKNFRIFLQLR